MSLALSSEMPGLPVIRLALITSRIGVSGLRWYFRSRLVTMPTTFVPSMIGMPEMWCLAITSWASLTVAVIGRVLGSVMTPFSLRLTFSTSSAWSAALRFLWITPMPPICARAMARRCSVTVSMADDSTGMLSRMRLVSRVATSVSFGTTSL